MLCCNVTMVPELRKPERTWCTNCNESGCGIYETRPKSCRTFECAWLLGELPDEMRPDKVHVMIEKVTDSIRLVLEEPGFIGSWQKIEDELNKYAKLGITLLVNSDSGKHMLLPDGKNPDLVMAEIKKHIEAMN
jgi:Fe-S-cluster containining protein